MFRAFATWRSTRQAIRELSSLSDRELSDIGLIRGDIESVVREAFKAESTKPAASPRVRTETATGFGKSGALSGLPSQA